MCALPCNVSLYAQTTQASVLLTFISHIWGVLRKTDLRVVLFERWHVYAHFKPKSSWWCICPLRLKNEPLLKSTSSTAEAATSVCSRYKHDQWRHAVQTEVPQTITRFEQCYTFSLDAGPQNATCKRAITGYFLWGVNYKGLLYN